MFLFVFPTRSYLAQQQQVRGARHDVEVLEAKNKELDRQAQSVADAGRDRTHGARAVQHGVPRRAGVQRRDPREAEVRFAHDSALTSIDRAREFLADRYGGRASDVAEVRAGDWSTAFAFQLNGRELIARFSRWREDFEKDRAAMAYSCVDLPVPRVLEIGDAYDGAYAISERHFGVFLESLDAEGFARVIPALLRALDVMRSLPVPHDKRSVPWIDWLRDALVDHPGARVSGWREKLAASSELDALFVAGQKAFDDLSATVPDIHHVLHLDLINRNVLVAEDRTKLEAVFDWGCTTYGDFLYEVAWFTFWSPWYPGLAATDMLSVVRTHYAESDLPVENFGARIRSYELHIGLHHLAYNTFVPGREEDLVKIASRLRELI